MRSVTGVCAKLTLVVQHDCCVCVSHAAAESVTAMRHFGWSPPIPMSGRLKSIRMLFLNQSRLF